LATFFAAFFAAFLTFFTARFFVAALAGRLAVFRVFFFEDFLATTKSFLSTQSETADRYRERP
jgi:hypothetical protein